ncbi:YlxR family protein [Aeromicrobium duanguangcaii]|uniref:YlxR family protein n=1 Tax=Aeromicrobium duanguangcaii TaxID=2968086 RepID=A0ABY5KAY8_9ACTN|nr:YlxR family protein [Aeromicrobium duanguangcaii]UUI67475.1 YlxR family protein [Aeromicrobium duanguangcaii]
MVIRTCVGCRQRADKTTLVRVVADRDDTGWTVEPDPGGSRPGRGAHLHPAERCLKLALDRRAFVRALRLEGPVSTDAVAEWVRVEAARRA